ncbi:MAG: hypothetical protein LBG21_07715, partial [Campylobacteraceae bacterium]|nr:hypothetical protein [Campylobacteraceae bacterium]
MLFEYRFLDMSLEIGRIAFTKEKSVSFQLKRFGRLGIRVYCKKTSSSSVNYTFLSGRIEYNEKTAFECLNPNKQNYIEAVSQILDIVEIKNKKTEAVMQVINNLHAISSFNYNITEYFKEQNINEISIFGHQDEVELSKLIYINARYAKDFSLKYCLANNYFEYHIPLIIGMNTLIKHKTFDETIILNETDTILFCVSIRDEKILNDIKNKTKAKVIHLLDVIWNILLTQSYTKYLAEIKNNNPNIPIIFCLFPNVEFVQNKSEIEQKTQNDFWLKNKITPPALKRFGYSFEDSIMLNKGHDLIKNNNISCAKNINSKYRNVVNNFRLTTDTPDNFKNTIYIFGSSVTFGFGAYDEDTIASNLQRLINEYFKENVSYCVLNCANYGGEDHDYQFDLMKTISFKIGDIIIISGHKQHISNAARNYSIFCPTQHAFERPHNMGEVFIDKLHLNKIGNQKIAELLFQTMLDNHLFDNKSNDEQEKIKGNDADALQAEGNTEKTKEKKTNTQIVKNSFIPKEENENLKKYKELLLKNKTKTKGKIGSIVMNCNPFTLGHRYLIDQSIKKVNHLYIFVV